MFGVLHTFVYYVLCSNTSNQPVEMVSILSEYVHESIIVGLTLGQADGCGVEILFEQCLQLGLCVILIKTNQLVGRGRRGVGGERELS